MDMRAEIRGGDIVAETLEACGIATAFGIASVHNMPILDAVAARGRIRFVPTRGEAGGTAMADAYARTSGRVAAVVSSTGPGAANAVGSLLEAATAGVPILHVTGQIPSALIGRGGGSVHESRDQLGMLDSVCKAALRVGAVDRIVGTVTKAVEIALTPPMGPVSVEVPIDIQKRTTRRPDGLAEARVAVPDPPRPSEAALDALADRLAGRRRVLVWTGAGAFGAAAAVERLVALGFGAVTSMHGRGILPEDHPMTLGAFNVQGAIQAFYETCDAMVVAASRLRGHETRDFTVPLPNPLYQIDLDRAADGRAYPVELFVHGDAALALEGLADRLGGVFSADPAFADDLAAAKAKAVAAYHQVLGPYATFSDLLREATPRDAVWVRDITISNSSWGNRLFQVYDHRDNVYPVGAGIGLGLSLGIGAAIGSGRPVVCMSGDGGFTLNIAEACTAVQEKVDVAFVVMNDHGYGILRNIQQTQYAGRRFYADVTGPEFGTFARSIGMPHFRIDGLDRVKPVMADALRVNGPALVEVDMAAIGPFSAEFPPPPAGHDGEGRGPTESPSR